MHMQAIAIHIRYNKLSLGNCGLSQCLHNSLQHTHTHTHHGKQQAINVSCVTHAVLRKWTGKRWIVEEHSQTISNKGRALQVS